MRDSAYAQPCPQKPSVRPLVPSRSSYSTVAYMWAPSCSSLKIVAAIPLTHMRTHTHRSVLIKDNNSSSFLAKRLFFHLVVFSHPTCYFIVLIYRSEETGHDGMRRGKEELTKRHRGVYFPWRSKDTSNWHWKYALHAWKRIVDLILLMFI